MEQNKTAAASLSHLLAEEGETTQKHLLQCFFNYVLLGQWELARSASSLICQDSIEGDRERILKSLIDVASNPYEQSTGSRTVTSPEQLSWLAIQEYEQQIFSGTQGIDISALKQDIEFRLLLVQECGSADGSVLQEVYQYFQRHHGTGQVYSQLAAFDSRESLPRNVSDFVKKKLREHPATGHHLIAFLMPKKHLSDNKDSEALQGLYIQSINGLIDSLPPEGSKRNELCNRMFELLAFYDPEPYWNYLQIRQLFTRLITLTKTDDTNFSIERIMESLMGCTRAYLMDEFSKLLQEVDVGGVKEMVGDLSEEHKLVLHLLAGKDRDSCWQRYFVSCLKGNKHCLGLIMETCISLVKAEQFESLGQFLATTELRRLQPVVLLACWTYCQSSDSARRLLDTLWKSAGPGTHPALTAGCKKLAYQLSLIKWCLERARPLLESSESATSQPTYGERATKLLHGLETHSVLFVLHRSTQLAALDSQEVLRLLQNVARGSGDGEKKKQKSVHFHDDSQSPGTKEPISAEQELDICIYRSYCAVKNVMDSIVFCYENSDLDLMNPIRVKKVLKPKKYSAAVSIDTIANVSSSEGDESSTPSGERSDKSLGDRHFLLLQPASVEEPEASFEELYQRCVWQKIQQAREHLQHLYPLAYRVEIVENIFSLLFCRHNDILEGALTLEGESDYELEGESKTDSLEFLNMSTVSEDEGDSEKFGNSLKDDGSASSVFQQTDSAIGSLASEEKMQRSGSIEYDTPFHEQKRERSSHPRLSRSRHQDSSDNIRSSTHPDYSCGFLANDYVVRDVLAMLKDALVDLNAVKFKMQGRVQERGKQSSGSTHSPSRQSGRTAVSSIPEGGDRSSPRSPEKSSLKSNDADFNPALEKLLSRTVSSSISAEAMQKRIAQLTQHIHEAQWRFQLVAHEMIPRQPGRVLEEVVVVTDDDSYVACIADEWMTPNRPQSAEAVRSQSGRRSLSSIGTAGINPQHPSQQSVIARMLSPPDSLLTMCLTRGNFAQAAQVIKLLKISEKTREASEAAFTEAFTTTAKSISTLNVTTRETRTSSGSVRFSLEAVKSAAAAGVANATLSNFVDNLLANPNIPPLPKPQWVNEHGKETVHGSFFLLDMTTAILLDLACTMCQTWELCNNVFNIIKAKGKMGKPIKDGEDVDGTDAKQETLTAKDKRRGRSSSIRLDLKGCQRFFQQLDGMLQLGHGDSDHWTATAMHEVSAITSSSAAAGGGGKGTALTVGTQSPSVVVTSAAGQRSLVQHFRSGASVLNATVVRQYETCVREVQLSFEQTSQALLASSRLDRQESINIDESHFAKSPGIKQSPSSFTSESSHHTSSLGSGGSSLSREGPGRLEMPLLHQRMKHLIAVMEKFVPLGGLYMLFIHGRMERGMLRNYLLSMYEHVKELAYVVAECESKSSEMLILPKNYFSILQEGPVDILGRLMFVKRVLPARLEKVATKLSLNLTHIIVQSCCPQIPSKHLPPIPTPCIQGVEKVGAKSVYNSGRCEDKTTCDPDVLVRTVLKDILSAMQEISIKCNGKGIFTEMCGRQLVQSEYYVTMVTRLRGLQEVDLSVLDSRQKRLCFFTNLLNLMTIHYHLHNIRQCAHVEEWQRGGKGEGLAWGLSGLEGKHLLDMVTQLGAFCYRVGQLGVLSLFDLKYVMLHHGQNLSHKWKSLITNGGNKLAPDDPMSVFMPPAEPRLLFVVSDGCLSSPPVQVLEPSELSTQLDAAAKSYLSHTVRLDTEKRKVSLPLLLTTLSLDTPDKKRGSETHTMFDNLLNFVSINAEVSQAQLLDTMTHKAEEKEKPAEDAASKGAPEVSLTQYITDFAYVFRMENVAVTTIQSEAQSQAVPSSKPPAGFFPVGTLHRSKSYTASLSAFLPHHFLLESSGSHVDVSVSMARPASYQLTPVTLDYVRETSGLVATLLTLLCSDELDDLETQFTDDHFQTSSLPRSRASSDISLVDIRSYRYHRLVDDFPILQRHLLTYIIPLAGADNLEISHSAEPILKFVTNVIDEDVKVCLFSLHDSFQFLEMLHMMSSRLTAKRQWQALIPVLRSIPEVVVDTYPHLKLLHDFVVSCWGREFSALLPKSKPLSHSSAAAKSWMAKINTLHQLRKLYCSDTQARVVVAVCDGLPVDWGLDLLELCLSQSIQPGLCTAVKAKHHYLSVYHRITSCIKTLQIKLAMQQSDICVITSPSSSLPTSSKELQKVLAQYEDWRHVAQVSGDNPKEVMSVLIQAGDFVVVRDWAKLHQLPPDLMMEIEVWYMMSLLSASASDTLPAYQALEDLRKSRPGECVEVCQSLLKRLEDQHKVKFLTGYMLRHLTANLPEDDLEDLRLMKIGAKALLCIPKSMRGEYFHLVSCPHLILEQLLMNMKGELAGQVFEKIRDDFKEIKESKLRVAQDQFNLLLTSYARKALEVTVVQAHDGHSSNLGSPRPNSADSESSKEEVRTTPSQRLAADVMKVRKRNMDNSASPSKTDTTPSSSLRRSSILSTTPAATTTSNNRGGSAKFIMPPAPPPPDQWVPDSRAPLCMVCKLERFSMFNRRHHCRRCGRVVCAACSTKRSPVKGVPARTCDECYEQIFGTRSVSERLLECYEQIFGTSESRARDEQEVYSQRMKESLSGASPSPRSSSFGHTPSQFRSSEVGHTRSLSSVVHHDLHEWKLKTDEGLNSYVREEFYYEQAPSVALCMSILEHHTDTHTSGQLILTMCDDLSSFLQPIAPGVSNPEVDYGLVISIIRELLFRAKMIFLKGGDSGMIGKCDAYQTRVDLLKILLEANYPDLPTLQELSKTDTARRLGDKLVKDERLQLALEVCTKCGVEATGVWLAWGRACLQCGDFAGARDKFAHCLKAPKDKNQAGVSSRLLMEIIDLLESLPPSGMTEIQMLLSNPASMTNLINMPIPAQQEETSVDSIVYQECMHYLRTYGTYTDHLKFLLRNGYWNKALKFVVDRRCSTEVFVESVLQPTLKAGDMTRLIEQLLMHDSSLDQWMPHLSASCRYLLKTRNFHVLYNLQIFMKDFLRAAMTCITHFYQQGSQSYRDLSERLQFLFIAQEHMQAFFDPMKWGAVRHPSITPITPPAGHSPRQRGEGGGGSQGAQLCMPKDDVTRHLRTIGLQIEVTQFLDQCLTSGSGEATAVATQFVAQAKSSTSVPTLFGNQEQRKDVVKMILLSGGKISVAFDLSMRIFSECQLKAVVVLKRVMSGMLKHQRLKEMLELLNMTEKRQILDEEEWDEVVSSALLEITEKQIEAREETETLTKMIRKEHNKINALIMTGKLRSAYLTAAKTNRVQDITRIMGAAERMGQAAVRNICKKWLEQHQK
ncbi:hypothetical protein V1264_018289 [Littorina saxatilis]|uniref:FYVE-type domain-containing protein n=1 Tax=Littorina saxatilis TaxID=31220 RepID=A0AAN9BDU4_9CAEN